ncbi:unnamed protein product [Dimorphilus gyrociliatus]|uniref:Uncharacterized protein n=1 Tax=Dimorphilus gyrociliatus TaxID=2664684 RepID=A0A7I8VXT4_9ANNE|nr:unnamed protein product [Dimorphilus gyrociliatus]
MKKILLKSQALLKKENAKLDKIAQPPDCVKAVEESSKVVSFNKETQSEAFFHKEEEEKVCTMTLLLESKSYVLKQQDSKNQSSIPPTQQQLQFTHHLQQQQQQQQQRPPPQFQLDRSFFQKVPRRQRVSRHGPDYSRSATTMRSTDNSPASFRCYFPTCYCQYSYNKHVNPNLRQTYRQSSNPHMRYNGQANSNASSTSFYPNSSYSYSGVNFGQFTPNTAIYNDYSPTCLGYSRTANPVDRRSQRSKPPYEEQKPADFSNIGPIDYSMDARKSI